MKDTTNSLSLLIKVSLGVGIRGPTGGAQKQWKTQGGNHKQEGANPEFPGSQKSMEETREFCDETVKRRTPTPSPSPYCLSD